MIYAPVIIPTLNRVVHLQRCLYSLIQNTYADLTEIYISVDYPPSKKYEEGWNDLKIMLKNMDLSVFKHVYIFYQNKNLGSAENSKYLIEVVSKKYDRYIYSEDDNEFSPNMLAYMNKELELYKNNPKIIGICAARDTDWINSGNISFSKFCPAYGFGTWVDKENKINKEISTYLLDKNHYNIKDMFPLFLHNGLLFKYYVKYIICKLPSIFIFPDGQLCICDSIRSIYMHLTDYVSIAPAVGKARTWGNDGTGEHMPKKDVQVEDIMIDPNNNFVCDESVEVHFIKKNYQIGHKYLQNLSPGANRIIGLAYYTVFLLCGKNEKKITRLIEILMRFQMI